MLSLKNIGFIKFIWYASIYTVILMMLITINFFVYGRIGVYELLVGVGVALSLTIALRIMMKRIILKESVLVSQDDSVHEEAFYTLYERSPVGYLTILSGGEIVDANPAGVNLLKSAKDKVLGVNFFELLGSNSDTDSSIIQSKIEAGLTIKDTEMTLKTFNGRVIWVTLSVFVYREKKHRLVSLVDITEQKSVDTAKSEFVALATHQLRTPISAIRWNVELLERNLRKTKTEDQDRYLIKINRNVIRMINLINDFLSVSKLEMGTFATKAEEINLSDFFTKIIDEFSEKITEKNITLNRQDVPEQLTIKSDDRLLHIIISNLMSNAVKYLKSEGTISLTYKLMDNKVIIELIDDGIGIPASEIDGLFTKFFRASNAQSQQTEGTGLGLYVVKQSAELLGGTVSVDSIENKGTKFIVTLPVEVASTKK